jgi:chitinase
MWTRLFEPTQMAPYSYKGNQWVGYDDTESVNGKIEYILYKDFGGAMFWSIETDDFSE